MGCSEIKLQHDQRTINNTPVLKELSLTTREWDIAVSPTVDFELDDVQYSETTDKSYDEMILTLKTLEEIEYEDLLLQ